MNQKQYQKVLTWCKDQPTKEKILTLLCKYSPISVIIIYSIMLGTLFFQQDPRLLKVILIPLVTLVIISIMRKLYNSPRPSEVYDIEPLVKHRQGESFPSRHSASATIIAFSCLYMDTPLGILCFFIALYVCLSRILAGVHFIKDVLAAVIISSLFGSLFFIL